MTDDPEGRTMAIAETRIENPEAGKAEWLDRLSALVSDVKGWVEPSGWRTRQVTSTVTEPDLGSYEVTLLLMERGEVEVILSPLARTGPGTDGVVDLYLMPGYDDLASLDFEDGRWLIRRASPPGPRGPRPVGEADRVPLNGDSLNRVLGSVAHA
jgi:hypothetical protein